MKILEPGCGRGEFLKAFKDLGLEVTGLDISNGSSEYFIKENELVISDIEDKEGLPFQTITDIIYNKSMLEHLYKPDLFLKKRIEFQNPMGK